MKLSLTYYFLLFMIYSIMGWLLEVICKLNDEKKFINRGFLIGPYCPIYGCGAVLITFLLYRYSFDPLVLFIMTTTSCGILEYMTSFIMEKLYKARWWDYSKRLFNINGRVCLGTLIPFGIFGLIITYITNPFITGVLDNINIKYLNISAILGLLILILDNIISTIIILGFRKTTIKVGKELNKDNTEQITKEVRKILSNRSWGYKRLIEAFPNLETIKFKIQEITDEVKENAKEIKENINEKVQDVKTTINSRKEIVKNNISEKTEEMKTNITNTGKTVLKKISYRKRKIKVSLNLNKKKLIKVFKKEKPKL